jgi:pimeloyl-ACP methyl ester carboxylesterase
MNRLAKLLLSCALIGLAGCNARESGQPADSNGAVEAPIPSGFSASTADVNGAKIFYLRGGSGSPVVLIHGFPEDHSAWRDVAPKLAAQHTVIVPDLRGIGRSVSPAEGPYDAATLAEDLRQLLVTLELRSPYIVGHDMGGLVAFAYAAGHPTELRGAMLIENPLPGLPGWDEIAGTREVWHINFHQALQLPEIMIRGHEAAYFRTQFFGSGMGDAAAVDDVELARYVAAYARPSQLSAGLGQYRATPRNAELNRMARGAISTPLTLVATEGSIAPINADIESALRDAGWSAIDRVTLPGRGHYLMDETPDAIVELVLAASRH